MSAVPANANANAKNSKGVSCQTLGSNGSLAGKPVLFNVRPRSANSAAPMVATNATAPVKAATKAEVDPIIQAIEAAVSATVTKDNLADFNKLLKGYRDAVPGAEGVVDISADITPDTLATAVGTVVAAVKASAPKAGGGRRKTHRKKHGMRSKRHCKTHKKHGGKRSTKHHKKHGKKHHGKRSKTHKKRHHRKH